MRRPTTRKGALPYENFVPAGNSRGEDASVRMAHWSREVPSAWAGVVAHSRRVVEQLSGGDGGNRTGELGQPG